jgi:transposase InsO family protein
MHIYMRNAEDLAPVQIAKFLEASQGIDFAGKSRAEVYHWVQQMLTQQEYFAKTKRERGSVRAYMAKVTGRSLPQITRLIRQYRETGKVESIAVQRHNFTRKYTTADLALLAEVDRAHERLSGPATKRILEREYRQFGRKQFEHLANLSVSHLYNLRNSGAYRKLAAVFEKTRPAPIAIGERRKPNNGGQPGWLRIDTVHQGKWDGCNGVFHINAVDEVTQWEVVGCCGAISEQHLIPVLEAILHQFPFVIRGLHADNGSEFVNHTVARLLNKLRIEFTRSRPERSQDNALVEGKNGAIVRKHIGYGHIPAEHAELIQKFYTAHFNPYLNFHRPCAFGTITYNERGKRERIYEVANYRTPLEQLQSLPGAENCLKPGVTFRYLEQLARNMSDTECAAQMRTAKLKLLRAVKIEAPFPPTFT